MTLTISKYRPKPKNKNKKDRKFKYKVISPDKEVKFFDNMKPMCAYIGTSNIAIRKAIECDNGRIRGFRIYESAEKFIFKYPEIGDFLIINGERLEVINNELDLTVSVKNKAGKTGVLVLSTMSLADDLA